MINEEAIKILKTLIPKTCKMVDGRLKGGFDDTDSSEYKAIQIAINALENQIPKKLFEREEKMTDNEIINDFEKEIKYVRENEKYDDFNPIVDIDLCEDILDLINRQKAEIERLQNYNENLQTANIALSNEILEIKSEAIKEFAEQLRKRFYFIDGHCVVDIPQINNLVKQMTE